MIEVSDLNNPNDYDTTINVIGGLKDVGVIYKVIGAYFSESDSPKELILDRNEFNLRTERSQDRVERAIRRTFLNFISQEHEDLCRSFFVADQFRPEKEMTLFWQFSMINRLFREISIRVFVKAYFAGRVGLSKDDLVAYLKEFLSQNKQLDLQWSESTIDTLATKYLNLMTKLNLLDGARIKAFRHIRTSDESLMLFLYFARLHEPKNRNILKNEMLPLSFVAPEDILERLKRLSIKGFFEMSYNGVELNVDLTRSYKEISDVLYHRSSTEI